jgi:hypothetical protein
MTDSHEKGCVCLRCMPPGEHELGAQNRDVALGRIARGETGLEGLAEARASVSLDKGGGQTRCVDVEPLKGCRRCTECEGQEHHWLMADCTNEDGTPCEPFIPCKHCHARAGVCDRCDDGVIFPVVAGRTLCDACLQEEAPHVCPGCQAVGSEPHAGYCSDAAIEREQREAQMRGDYDRDDAEEDDGPADDPPTSSQRRPPSPDREQALAIARTALTLDPDGPAGTQRLRELILVSRVWLADIGCGPVANGSAASDEEHVEAFKLIESFVIGETPRAETENSVALHEALATLEGVVAELAEMRRIYDALVPDDGLPGFGVDPKDSVALLELRQAVDDALGWETLEQEEAADYPARVRQFAYLRLSDPSAAPEGENVLYLARSKGHADSFCVGCLPTDDWKPEQIVGWVSLDILKELLLRGSDAR